MNNQHVKTECAQKIMEMQLDFIFTDGHTVDGFTLQYTPKDINNIDTLIDWTAVKAKYWRSDNDLDLKRRKEAEFLILGDIAIDAILGFLVSNEEAKNKLIIFGADAANVHIRSDYYF